MEQLPTKKKHTTLILTATIIGLLLLTPIGSTLADNTPNLEIVNLSGASKYAQLSEMPKTVVYAELYCYGALVTYGDWGGVLLSYLLTQAQVTLEVGSIQLVASDGYRVAIPIDLAMQPEIIIAYEKDNQPLSEGLRLIIPGANGAAWIAMITSITMRTSGAEYPDSVSAGVPKVDNPPNPSSTTQPSPTKQQVPQPQQSAENSSSSQEAVPTNVTQTYQPEINPQNLKTIIVYLIAVSGAISFTAAAYVVLRRNRKQPSKTS